MTANKKGPSQCCVASEEESLKENFSNQNIVKDVPEKEIYYIVLSKLWKCVIDKAKLMGYISCAVGTFSYHEQTCTNPETRRGERMRRINAKPLPWDKFYP